jgi:hypothetical protein
MCVSAAAALMRRHANKDRLRQTDWSGAAGVVTMRQVFWVASHEWSSVPGLLII